MDKVNIDGIITTPLKKIPHPKGNIFHCMKNIDNGYSGFGEAYFSTIKSGQIKGWNKHLKMTLNLIVPVGSVTFVVFDNRKRSPSKGYFQEVGLSSKDYNRLTIEPGLWIAFKGGIFKKENLILNIANLVHDPTEIVRKDLKQFKYDWGKI